MDSNEHIQNSRDWSGGDRFSLFGIGNSEQVSKVGSKKCNELTQKIWDSFVALGQHHLTQMSENTNRTNLQMLANVLLRSQAKLLFLPPVVLFNFIV